MRAVDRGTLLALAGAALLAAASIAALPFSRGLLRAPRTPYDAGGANFTVPAWIVLMRAQALVPASASVLVRSEPPDPAIDTYLHRFAIALLPGRKIVPAALWGVPTDPDGRREAEYEIVIGPSPATPSGPPVLEIPEGSIWRRAEDR